MSLEDTIANLAQQAGLLLDLPQAIQTQATAKIDQIAAAYNQRIATLETTVYINQATGSDANDGSINNPVKSLGKALAMTPLGGRCTALLQTDYTIDEVVDVKQRQLLLRSAGAVRYVVNFTRRQITTTTPNLRRLDSFALYGNASINVYGLKLVIPALDGVWPNYSDTIQSALFSCPSSNGAGNMHVAIGSCDIDIPATPFGAVIGADAPMSLHWTANTLVGTTTSVLGRVVRGITNTAGTAVPPWLKTNLTQI